MEKNHIKRFGQRGPHRRNDPGRLRLWPIGWALAACCVAAGMALAGLTWLAWALLRKPKLPHSSTISLHDAIGVLQLVFASVAGAGALVALVVAYRRQKVAETEAAHDGTRVLNERFTTIAAQLGDDQAAVRLAGVHAMAGLADDWEENRQTCIDVLCAYLRMPYEPEPGDEAPSAERLAFRGIREVRHTVIRVIAAHLGPEAVVSWQGLNFDFTGVTFDGGDFSGARFSGGEVSFSCAKFSGGEVNFSVAAFSGSWVNFRGALFSGGEVNFSGAAFSGGGVNFSCARFSGGTVRFNRAAFSGAEVSFNWATFSGGTVRFDHAVFSGGWVHFLGARFSGGTVSFSGARFSGGTVRFNRAAFSGAEVTLGAAVFSGGEADFSSAADWSDPPTFDWKGAPPAKVKLPTTRPGHGDGHGGRLGAGGAAEGLAGHRQRGEHAAPHHGHRQPRRRDGGQ